MSNGAKSIDEEEEGNLVDGDEVDAEGEFDKCAAAGVMRDRTMGRPCACAGDDTVPGGILVG